VIVLSVFAISFSFGTSLDFSPQEFFLAFESFYLVFFFFPGPDRGPHEVGILSVGKFLRLFFCVSCAPIDFGV